VVGAMAGRESGSGRAATLSGCGFEVQRAGQKAHPETWHRQRRGARGQRLVW
jgi:hypothetical protein